MHRALTVVAVAVVTGAAGCGGIAYTARANSVAGKVEAAKEVQAEQYAPYYYYSAKERVEKAAIEAARADYDDALDLLDEAEADADQAVQQAEAVRKGAGR
jgi:hypothetical protein